MAVFTLDELKEALGKDVDEAYELSQEIVELEAKYLVTKRDMLVALKNKIERNMGDEDIDVIQGQKGRAKWVKQNKKKIDLQALCVANGIKDEEVEKFTKMNKVKYILINKRH